MGWMEGPSQAAAESLGTVVVIVVVAACALTFAAGWTAYVLAKRVWTRFKRSAGSHRA